MIKPLTKKRSNDGDPYFRPPEVERNIKGALGLGTAALRSRLKEDDPGEHLKSECLVHLFREARDKGDDGKFNLLAEAILSRCEGILLSKLPKESLHLLDDILADFGCLLANDSMEELDYYECKFNLAFRTFWLGIVRTETRRCQKMETRSFRPTSTEAEGEEERVHTDEPSCRPTESDDVARSELLDQLPPKIRDAAILREMGYGIAAVATHCDVSERTIHNWLNKAKEILPSPKEPVR